MSAHNPREEFSSFMQAQMDNIEKDKLLAQEKGEHTDAEWLKEWIESNSADFRERWETSICRCCCLAKKCGHYTRKKCKKFQQRSEQ